MNKLLEALLMGSPKMDIGTALICLSASMICAIFIRILHTFLYTEKGGSYGIGQAILLISPSVTAIFLTVQASVPLSIGLLGALSFIRFRTPIKDAEEIAYILLTVATSVACSVSQFILATTLLLFIALVLGCIRLFGDGKGLRGSRGSIVVAISAEHAGSSDTLLREVLGQHLSNVTLRHISKNDESIILQYDFRQRRLPPPDRLLSEIKNRVVGLLDLNLVSAT